MEFATEPVGFGDEVLLRLPARAESLPIARTLAAAVASQWGFTLDVVDDARLVVSELLTHVLKANPECLTHLTFTREASSIRVSVHTDEPIPAPSSESFGWLVVSELASAIDVLQDESGLTITAALTTAGTTDGSGSR